MSNQSSSIARALRPRGPVRLRLSRRRSRDLTVIEVAGELDLLTAGKLGAEIDQELRQGSGDVVVDLRDTEFVDSAGLHVLLNAQRRLTRQSRALGVVCEPGPVRRVFELARLAETLGVVDSVREHRRRAATAPRIKSERVSARTGLPSVSRTRKLRVSATS
jgi:anti-sigma B factor antagonist